MSVGMFPHLFQHWLTAKSAKAFRLTVLAHPLCIMIVWVPCVLVGAWASGVLPPGIPPPAVLSAMLKLLVGDPVLTGLLTAGVLAAIMSSLDSQFLCLGTIFTNDVVLHRVGPNKYSDKQTITIASLFIVVIVALTYALAMVAKDANVFDLAIWCFSGFSALFPVVFASLYWKRATKQGVIASILGSSSVGLIFSSLGIWRRVFRWSRDRSGGDLLFCRHDCLGCRFVGNQAAVPGNPEEVFPETQLIEKLAFSLLLNSS